jgi:antitoxin (DNA-binding transcriptional repressor) of toxin-antitoxin stability system
MTKTVQSSALDGTVIRRVMDGEWRFVSYQGRLEALIIPIAKRREDVDAILVLVREHLEQAVQRRG